MFELPRVLANVPVLIDTLFSASSYRCRDLRRQCIHLIRLLQRCFIYVQERKFVFMTFKDNKVYDNKCDKCKET